MQNIRIFFNTLLLLLTFSLYSCSGISLLSKKDKSDLYNQDFLVKIEKIKKDYFSGNSEIALNQLLAMNDASLRPSEVGMKHNLIGVIYFTMNYYERALEQFNKALTHAHLDESLEAQIHLNMSSTYFKQNNVEKSFSSLNQVNGVYLSSDEQNKFFKLQYILSRQLGNKKLQLKSLLGQFGIHKKISSIRSDQKLGELKSEYWVLNSSERMSLLNEFKGYNFLIVPYLSYLEAEKFYFSGDKSRADEISSWIKDEYADSSEVIALIDSFEERIQTFSKINMNAIGIILPFTGKKGKFAEKAMKGIDTAYQKTYQDKLDVQVKPLLHIRDSHGSGTVGAIAVKELVEKQYVSAIIGGLFPNEAKKEYLEAKKYGVFFISLSPIYLPREQKNHLLLEIPGSVESQIDVLLKSELLEKFGKKVAIVYPDTSRGKSYVNELWRRAPSAGVSIIGAQSFVDNTTDFRGPVEKILGLRFKRERSEELELWSKIHSLERKRSTRRLQSLTPEVEFDWVYLPVHPHEALQIIPSFEFFDAFNLTFVGAPSWRSRTLIDKSYKIGAINFIGPELNSRHENFIKNFQKLYSKKPHLVETMAFDSMLLISKLFGQVNFSSREEFDAAIRSQETLSAVSGDWQIKDNIWIKNLETFQIRRGQINKVSYLENETKSK